MFIPKLLEDGTGWTWSQKVLLWELGKAAANWGYQWQYAGQRSLTYLFSFFWFICSCDILIQSYVLPMR